MKSDDELKASGQWDYGSNRPRTSALIAAQLDGEPLILAPDMEVTAIQGQTFTAAMASLVQQFKLMDGHDLPAVFVAQIVMDFIRVADKLLSERTVESNFNFYVDGYTLQGTDKVGELYITGPEGNAVTVKSSVLTGFLERRLSPPNVMPLQDDVEGRN